MQRPADVDDAGEDLALHRQEEGARLVRHHDRPGVLATVLEAIKSEQINVQEMENIVFEGAAAAVARINLDNAPSQESLRQLEASSPDIIELDLLKLV